MNMHRPAAFITLCALFAAACGKQAPPPEQDEATPTAASEPATTPQREANAAPTTAALSVEDLDRRDRGVAAELQAVADAGARLEAAKDDNEKLEAMMAATEMQTIEKGAQAAGLGVDRYRYIRDTIGSAAAQVVPLEREMDVSGMPPEMLQQMKAGREASVAALATQLPADVLAAMRARAEGIRAQDLGLAARRLEVASKAR